VFCVFLGCLAALHVKEQKPTSFTIPQCGGTVKSVLADARIRQKALTLPGHEQFLASVAEIENVGFAAEIHGRGV
jgi:hypothetical protein